MPNVTVNIHRVADTKPTAQLIGPDPVTVCVRFGPLMNSITLFFGSVQEGVDYLTDAITALKHAEHTYLNPPLPVFDGHLEAAYDDRNGD